MIRKILSKKEAHRRSIAAVFLTVILSGLLSIWAMASSEEAYRVPDLTGNERGTLTVNLTYVNGNEETGILSGATLHAYQVADVTASGGSANYQWCSPYDGIDSVNAVKLEGMTADQSNIAAEAIKKYIVDSKITGGKMAVSDDNGKAVFSDLTPGIYLVYRDDADVLADQEKETINPFLVMVPAIESADGGNRWNFQVSAFPKVGIPRPSDGHDIELGSVIISKKVLNTDGEETVFSDKVFYAGVFTKETDGSYTLVKDTLLKQNGTAVIKDLKVGTYYLFETTKDGTLVDTDSFAFEITGNGQIIQLGSGDEITVTLTNREKEQETETEKKTTTSRTTTGTTRTGTAVKTGDETPIVFYAVMLAGAAVAAAGMLIRRRKIR